MDGLIALIFIGWIVASLGKKKGKTAKRPTAKPAAGSDIAKQRSEYAAKLRAEAERKKQEQAAIRSSQPEPAVINEGESFGDAGSLMYDSSEGECICDPELEHEGGATPAPESVYAGQIGLEPVVDFSAKGILQGVVMSEILTRPAQRARRMRR